jgi:hypothetical protein
MRIGLLAYIHGDLLALESVLNELQQEQVDQIIFGRGIQEPGEPHEGVQHIGRVVSDAVHYTLGKDGGVNELPDSYVCQCQVLLPGCSLP